MNGKVLVLPLLLAVTVVLTACGGQGVPPGSGGTTAVGGGALSVQLTGGPPTTMAAGSSVGLFATVFNDKNNAGATWSCTPANACGSFSPATTGYLLDTLYTAPVASANGPITQNLAYTVTITATSVADSSQSATSTSVNLTQQYAIVLYPGNGSFGMVASVTLDGNGNVIGGEADGSANGFYWSAPSITGTYTLDATGHGNISLSLNNSTCCGTLQQTHGITATSNSHLIIAEEDNFNGLTIGAIGSMDLQAAATGFSGSQVSGGYSFTLSGYDGAQGFNGSWGGIFTADGSATAGAPQATSPAGSSTQRLETTGALPATTLPSRLPRRGSRSPEPTQLLMRTGEELLRLVRRPTLLVLAAQLRFLPARSTCITW